MRSPAEIYIISEMYRFKLSLQKMAQCRGSSRIVPDDSSSAKIAAELVFTGSQQLLALFLALQALYSISLAHAS